MSQNKKMDLSQEILKIVVDEYKLNSKNNIFIKNLKKLIINILISDDESKIEKTDIVKKQKKQKKEVIKPKSIKIPDLNIDYLDCQDSNELDLLLNDMQLQRFLDFYSLEYSNLKNKKNRTLAIEKLYSIVSILKEEKIKNKSLNYLIDEENYLEVRKLWQESNIYYKNIELRTMLVENKVNYQKLFYVPSQDFFIACQISKSGKLKPKKINISFEKDIEVLKLDKIKMENLKNNFTDIIEVNN